MTLSDATNMASSEPPLKKARLEESSALIKRENAFVSEANEVITFHLVESVDQLENEEDKCFNPEFSHQQFGDTQQIKGYKGLEVHFWMSAKDFRTYLDIRYEKKHLKPEHDLEAIFAQDFEGGLEMDRAAFEAHLSDPSVSLDPEAMGALLATHDLRDGSQLEIRRVCLPDASPQLKAVHLALEPLLLFFIDAASAIEKDDPLWYLHTAVRRDKASGECRVVGFCTLYNFFAYPDKVRTRLSQIFVLPPYQGLGIGYKMLEAANDVVVRDPECLELTYEDPTDDLNRIRDLIDCRRLLATEWFLPAVREAVEAAQAALQAGQSTPIGGAQGQPRTPLQEAAKALALPPSVAARARAELKVSSLQCARVWELCLFSTHEVRKSPAMKRAATDAMSRRMKCDEEQRKQQIARGKRVLFLNDKPNTDDWILMKDRKEKEKGPGRKGQAAGEGGDAAAGPSTSAPAPSTGPGASADGGAPGSVGGEGEGAGADSPTDSGVYVEPMDVVKARALQLQEILQDRLQELEKLTETVGEEIEKALAREAAGGSAQKAGAAQ